ncbi:Beta-galactosidase C-terminal domain [Piscicoccus intestinalis]|uniref:Beta-galactosidase C-terminal domain n=1 Tax=Piscicoccus intestinalis TaxID=746033 RepID=UPI0024807817|nr:Beta-galactosidase C-terminal domain [Piscicoccus intestinalis]
MRRVGAGGSWLFVLNHSTEPVRVAASGRDLVAGADVTGSLELAAGAVAVVAER